MPVIYRKYGPYIEITRYQKTPHPPKVRLYRRKNRNRPHGPRRADTRTGAGVLSAAHLTPPWRTTPFVASKCGCELSFLWLNQSSFPNSQRITESTFMGFCLTCHCITEIRELVDGLLRKGPNEKRENWPDYGDAVMWMQSKLTAHPDWHSISPSTSPKEQGK